MSGCHDSEKLCIHDVPMKFKCDKCIMDNRLYELEHLVNNLNHGLAKCFERIDEFREDINEKLEKEINNFYRKVERLEKNIQEMSTAISIKHKKSYKCPNCKSSGKIEYLTEEESFYLDCLLCEGKGIVWG